MCHTTFFKVYSPPSKMIIQVKPLILLWDKSRSKENNSHYTAMVTLILISLSEEECIPVPHPLLSLAVFWPY